MKKLVITTKPTSVLLDESLNRIKMAEKKSCKVSPHYEIFFTDMKQFKKFVSNIDLLKSILLLKPKSIYDLSKLLNKDVGNLNRLISFFEDYGAIELKNNKVNGRSIKKPVVPFKKIEFDLAS